MDNLFSTHPAMENRIAALEALEREIGGGAELDAAASRAGSSRGPWG
jgi:heat shock protein HtpX